MVSLRSGFAVVSFRSGFAVVSFRSGFVSQSTVSRVNIVVRNGVGLMLSLLSNNVANKSILLVQTKSTKQECHEIVKSKWHNGVLVFDTSSVS